MKTRKIKEVELHDEDLRGFDAYTDRNLSKNDLPLINCIYSKLCREADEEEIGDFYDGYGFDEGEYYPPFVVEAIEEYVYLKNKSILKNFYNEEQDFVDKIYSFFEKIDIEFTTPFHYEEMIIGGISKGQLIGDYNQPFIEWTKLSIDCVFKLIEYIKKELEQ